MGTRNGAFVSSQAAIKFENFLNIIESLDKTKKIASKRLELNELHDCSLSVLCEIIQYIESDNELHTIFVNNETFIRAKSKAVFLPE
jgi:hypothetical protein